MNNTLVMLGNGFDLDLGWKTSYSDFYNNKKNAFDRFNGMSFIQRMIVGKHWCNLEGYIRECILTSSKEEANVINSFWQICRDYIYDYLNNSHNEELVYTTKQDGCAYAFLHKLHDSSIISFNYTDPFTKNGLEYKKISHVHGSLKDNNAYRIKIGVDSSVKEICQFSNEVDIRCIIKSNNNSKIETFFTEIKKSRNIIIYGHSLGITDSDYFKPFFKSLIEGRLQDKNIYIVTYDENSLQDIRDNMLGYEIDFSDLLLAPNISVKIIFTAKGNNHIDFRTMIDSVPL